MASGGNTLSKAERLSGKKSIATLLADGKWGAYGHFRYCWLVPAAAGGSDVHSATATHGPAQKTSVNVTTDQPAICPQATSYRPGRILISVPKRFFKRAVRRNLLKRRIREAYRVQKVAGVDILFQYASAELADFEAIKADVTAILARVQAVVSPAAGAESTES